jgi:hypothetical protein
MTQDVSWMEINILSDCWTLLIIPIITKEQAYNEVPKGLNILFHTSFQVWG